MSSPLFELLADLAKHPRKFDRYRNDIETLLADYELTDEQKDLIRQGGEENFIRLLVEERRRLFGDMSF